MAKPENPIWYQMEAKDVLLRLKTEMSGLDFNEATKRLERDGLNELVVNKGLSKTQIFLQQIKSPMVYVLFVAAAISFLVGELFDVFFILFIVVVNTLVGFWQEYKADKSIQALQKLVPYKVTVIRNGKQQKIDAKEVVVGDILLLEAGDKVSADARILSENNLQVNEASLTGESFPVEKDIEIVTGEVGVGDRSNMVFLGTTIERGKAMAVTVATGKSTQIGEITSLVSETKDEKTPLQVQLAKVSRLLTVIVVAAAILVFVIGYLRALEVEELFVTAIALAVAAIPEGLLVAMTLVLVVGIKRILKKKALVRKLIAAETLGSVSVVLSDKTGTITMGKMQMDTVLVAGEKRQVDDKPAKNQSKLEEQHLLAVKTGMICNNAYIKNPEDKLKEWEIVGDATEKALLVGAIEAGYKHENLKKDYPRLDELPFNETYKYMATLNSNPADGNLVFVKGAPETIIDMCDRYLDQGKKHKIESKLKKQIQEEYEDLTKDGLRVLALAYKNVGQSVESFNDLVTDRDNPKFKDLIFIGWVGLKDPVREEVPQAFETMKKAGIRTIIITGDHRFTAKAIIKEVGMDVPDERIMEGKDLNKLSDAELIERIQDIDIFARVEPKHKLRIVKAWKETGVVVAVLGDGVNDAPALKAADIGVAVGKDATDVAKETADIILLEGNFSVIEQAIREGRVIFDNIRKVFLYLMSDSFTEILLLLLAIIFGYPLPLAAVQILWINIISDGLPYLALTQEPAEKDVMSLPPRTKDEQIVNNEVKMMIATITGVAVVAAFSLYVYFLRTTGDVEYARTFVFTLFAIDSIIFVFSVKSLRQPIWKTNIFSNKWLIAAVLVSIMMQVAVVYIPFFERILKTVPIKPEHWLIIFAVGLTEIFVRELIKSLYLWRKMKTA